MLRICAYLIVTLLFLTGVGYANNANAQVPTKEIKIYNNSATDTIYPVLSGFTGQYDLWLQAQFSSGGRLVDPTKQAFCNNDLGAISCSAPQSGVPRLYRAWINPNNGILPGQFVSIKVPFYTQLMETTPATIGTTSGQYIDWWNAQRIFFYDGKTAKTGAFNYNGVNNDKPPVPVPPTPVNPIQGAAVPSCASDNTFNCEPATVVYYKNLFPTGSIPFDFGEYTFAAAEGPPPGGLLKEGSLFTIQLKTVNFNVSAVDGIYLPIAMQALGNTTPVQRQYLGTIDTFDTFFPILSTFSNNGASWPYYFPSYFSVAEPTTAKPTPQDGDPPYRLPKVASENVVFAKSYKVPAPAPPVLSSNTNGTPMIGTTTQAFVDLWTKCTKTNNNMTHTCTQIRTVYNFFVTDYQQTCQFKGLPDTPTMLREVTGWAQFPGCSQPLLNTPPSPSAYNTAISTFCELEYNFLNPATPPQNYFNPYAALIHKTIGSNAYAFSIDDKAAFKSVPADGLIITIGGPNGLAFNEQAPLPTLSTIHTFCH